MALQLRVRSPGDGHRVRAIPWSGRRIDVDSSAKPIGRGGDAMRGSWLLLGLYVAAAVWHALPVSAQLTPEHILPAVAGIEAEAVPHARPAGTPGTTRPARGIVLDGAGLVTPIGFGVLGDDRLTV